jgi:hypothetical protein
MPPAVAVKLTSIGHLAPDFRALQQDAIVHFYRRVLWECRWIGIPASGVGEWPDLMTAGGTHGKTSWTLSSASKEATHEGIKASTSQHWAPYVCLGPKYAAIVGGRCHRAAAYFLFAE